MQNHTNVLSGEFVLDEASDTAQPTETKTVSQQSARISSSPMHFYSHLARNPDNITLEIQEEGETVLLVVRDHLISTLSWVSITILLLFLPVLIAVAASILSITIPFAPLTNTLIVAFFYLILLGYALLNFTLWYFQVTIVTSKRVIDVDLHGILSRDVIEAPLDSVKDVGYTQVGVFATLFDYGHVHMETETRLQDLEITKAPHPGRVVQIISDLLTQKGNHESD